ncbi:FtsX-like permease family protein [Candidatus Pacearchaeota archaeon]|nr:MAG: FtsX-like permease family protein [Candidatus Pacearchaeota archaeon]
MERTKEIGVMKAIGARNSDVLAIFVIEAGLLGLVGGAVGAVLGVGFAFGVAHSANSFFGNELFKVTISLPLVAAAMSFALLIGIISGIWPALQAAKLNPVEALRS